MKIKEYAMVNGNSSLDNFMKDCNDLLKKGYQPYRGHNTNILPLGIVRDKESLVFWSQAFVKYEEEEKTEERLAEVYSGKASSPKSDYELKPEAKERKAVDVFYYKSDFKEFIEEQEERMISKGFETVKKGTFEHENNFNCVSWEHELKMVKYED